MATNRERRPASLLSRAGQAGNTVQEINERAILDSRVPTNVVHRAGLRIRQSEGCGRVAPGAFLGRTSSEWRHVEVTVSTDTVMPKKHHGCLEQDSQIQKQALVIDVPNVQCESVLPVQRVATSNLGRTGDAGSDFVTTGLLRGIPFQIFGQ